VLARGDCGAGNHCRGIIVPPDGYFDALRRKTHKRGMLLIFDEAKTAFGGSVIGLPRRIST